MLRFFLASLLVVSSPGLAASTLYDIPFKTISGKSSSLKEYKGKAIVVVNTASKCGYTGQLDDLQKIYSKYKDKGLVVLGFPSNSFKQELEDDTQVAKFCKINYGVKFPMASIVAVKGKDAHPIFSYLTDKDPEKGGDVRWNFEKFIISRDGKVVKRFRSSESPSSKTFVQELRKVI
ncbi:glutathione peroxidase [Pseudobacteriovorax antillogorgiicola]|uniref:Glutathione peroxidase n=1 Tax=Pseudobacteriovorax antillogorgiicola TaxID=1513793 RepID=A0A1Y6CMJ5_9BACT|nr:glutathione peroxidase [Pseudobacteriovorax antillogorgiicola]TCS47597.1 glutathione peroxidase [Pseudobacteriovorax antillogorgiicola]SMF60162.1 glutathione peroxidase [Pseudobacteriovorax antillogorgiicola]